MYYNVSNILYMGSVNYQCAPTGKGEVLYPIIKIIYHALNNTLQLPFCF